MRAASEILSLGYLGVGADAVDDWRAFGTGLLGMQCIDATARALAFRMDERRQRLFVEAGRAAPVYGWETADAASLDRLAARLEAAGIAVERPARADQRLVSGLIAFQDPVGTQLEAFHGPLVTSEAFRPGRAISGFRTGPLGMGHVVLTVPRMDAVLTFYRDLLGFRLSDWTERPFRACFMHLNPRHHSLALIETGRAGMHHLMVELFSMDDVGQGYDLAQGETGRVATTLGRHTNDHMLSFYARTPSGFLVEYGWGGRDIDPATWQPFECQDGPSLWGHDRDWLPPERQREAREIRLAAAAKGERAPVHVIRGNHDVLAGACPWWTASVANAAD
jgi:2,3-dihydroxybiphenyl 1,2-dioxygenase